MARPAERSRRGITAAVGGLALLTLNRQRPSWKNESRRFGASRGNTREFRGYKAQSAFAGTGRPGGGLAKKKALAGRAVALGCSLGAVSVLPSGRWALATWRLDQSCRGGRRAQSLAPLSIRMRMWGDLAGSCPD